MLFSHPLCLTGLCQLRGNFTAKNLQCPSKPLNCHTCNGGCRAPCFAPKYFDRRNLSSRRMCQEGTRSALTSAERHFRCPVSHERVFLGGSGWRRPRGDGATDALLRAADRGRRDLKRQRCSRAGPRKMEALPHQRAALWVTHHGPASRGLRRAAGPAPGGAMGRGRPRARPPGAGKRRGRGRSRGSPRCERRGTLAPTVREK